MAFQHGDRDQIRQRPDPRRVVAAGRDHGQEHEQDALRERDDTLRTLHWRPLAALAHTFSRWHDVRSDTGMEAPSFEELLERHGNPPPPVQQVVSIGAAVPLPAPAGLLDEVLLRRYTGRNYDTSASAAASSCVVARSGTSVLSSGW